jgi:hypothetical protein
MEAGKSPAAGLPSWESPEYACVHCGGPIAEVLAWIGSFLCHDCRDEHDVDAMVIRAAPKHPPATRRFWPRGRKRPAASWLPRERSRYR